MRTIKVILLICVLFPVICSAQTVQSGSIYAWGSNLHGQCDVPEPNSGFVAVAGGLWHTLAIREDGSVKAWGAGTSDTSDYPNYGQCIVPLPNSGYKAIDAGDYHSLALREDGSIETWGYNNYGQCDVPSPNSGFVAIAAGNNHSLAIREDGSIEAWGRNIDNQCDVPSPNSGFVAIAAGFNHSLALRDDGSIETWGYSSFNVALDIVPSPNSGFVAIAADYFHSLGLREDGSIEAWGSNASNLSDVPVPNSGFVAIAAGNFHSLALREDGSIEVWGSNLDNQCDVPSPNSSFKAIAASSFHSLAIKGPPSYFQYQGMLIEEDTPVYGSYDLEFTLYDTADDVNLVASPVIIEDVNVIDGHYSVELDFGSDVFDGNPRWLEVWSRSAGSEDTFVMTGKREKLSPVPYALYAQNSGNASGGSTENVSRNSLDASDGSPTEAVYVDNDGNVGIGTTSPSETLDIFGTVKMTGFRMTTGASNGYVLTSNSSGTGTWQAPPTTSSGLTGGGTENYFPKFTGSTSLGISSIFEDNDDQIGVGTTNPLALFHIEESGSNDPFRVRVSGTTRFIISNNGYVGIGTASPGTKFEVQGGAIKATGGLIIETRTSDPSNPAPGQIWLRTDIP